jgi:hypothetical protein
MWNSKQLSYRAEVYDRFLEYLVANYGVSRDNKRALTEDYLEDIKRFSYILGKLDVYINAHHDMEQANYALKWFEKEFQSEYCMSDFKEWIKENPEDVEY